MADPQEVDVTQPNRHRRQTRYCADCDTPFKDTSGNRVCSGCRHRARRIPCSDCGDPIDPRSRYCMPCWGKRHTGESSARWTGGRTRHKSSGYVLVKAPAHPRARADGYVREHILVIEQELGRFLLPGETVHHRNGVRDDNRPENLELWTSSQPSGQRVSDLLAWAHEILARYGDHADSSTAASETSAPALSGR